MRLLFTFLTFLTFSMLYSEVAHTQCTFTVSNPNPCAQDVVTFTASGAGSFSWDFQNDGKIDAFGNPANFIFPQSFTDRTYTVRIYNAGKACGSQTITVKGQPDPSIGLFPGIGTMNGNEIQICSALPQAVLKLVNTSTTAATNTNYTIQWGDGQQNTYTNLTFNGSTVLEHTYNGFGYYNIRVTVTGSNGCSNTRTYTFYNGSNPAVGLGIPGGTVGLCVPATVTFNLNDVATNPAGTVYKVYVSGKLVSTYTQTNVPASFTYTFLESSCGKTTSDGKYQNAYDVRVVAENPCGQSAAVVAPIEVSEPPKPEFLPSGTTVVCVGQDFKVTNSTPNLKTVIKGNCSTNLPPSWEISGTNGVDWNLISGNLFNSNELLLEFLKAGNYTITMKVNSPSCGERQVSSNFKVVETSNASAGASFATAAGAGAAANCVPAIGTFNNTSSGDSLEYDWAVIPGTGWNVTGGTNLRSKNLKLQFNKPGSYRVILQARNSCSADFWDTTIVVAGPPVLQFAPLPDACLEATLNFSAANINVQNNGQPVTDYLWQFPGSTNTTTSTAQYPSNVQYKTPGNYIVSVTATNSCGFTTASDTFGIVTPGTVTLPPDFETCIDGSPKQLNAIPGGGIWSGPGVNTSGLFQPVQAGAGTHTITYNYGIGACAVSGTVKATVDPAPAVEAGPNLQVCIDRTPFALTDATPAGGTWSSTNCPGLNNNTIDPAACGPGSFQLQYTYTDPKGCKNTDTRTLLVNELPTVNAGPGLTICMNNNQYQLTGFSPAGGVWSGPGVNAGGQFNAANTTGPGTHILTYTFTDLVSGCQNADTVQVTVTPNDVASAGPDLTFCINDNPTYLNGFTPVGGIWAGPGTNADGRFDPGVAGIGYHILSYTMGSGICKTTDTRSVRVRALPAVEAGNDLLVCHGANAVKILNTSPAGGTWTGLGVDNNGNFNPSGLPVGNYTLQYSYTDPFGCVNDDFVNATIQPNPSVSVGPDTNFCNVDKVVFIGSAFPSGGTWSGTGLVDNKKGTIIPAKVGGPGSYTYVYEYAAPGTGCFNRDTLVLEIKLPDPVDAGPDQVLCVDAGEQILTNFIPADGDWSGNGMQATEPPSFDPAIAGEGSHQLRLTTGVGTCLVEDYRQITVIDLSTVNPGPDLSVCASWEPFFLGGASPAGGTWKGDGIMNPQSGLFDPSKADIGTNKIFYTYKDPNSGCQVVKTRIITVNPIAAASFVAPDVACINELITFENQSPSNYKCSWDFGNGKTSNVFSPFHRYANPGTYTINLFVSNQYGCTDTTSREIVITEAPTANFEPDTNAICSGLEVKFDNKSSGYSAKFSWDFGNGSTSTAINPGMVFYNSNNRDTTYIITLVASNRCGNSMHQLAVKVVPSPEANFLLEKNNGCSPLTINFANITTGNALAYYWDLGNGSFSNQAVPPSQTYWAGLNKRLYTITLIATNTCGKDTLKQILEVLPSGAEAGFTPSTLLGCAPLTVNFANKASATAKVDYDFGDGNTSAEANPVHVFTKPGNYTVMQYASTHCGYDTAIYVIKVVAPPVVKFTHNTIACAGDTVSFKNNSSNLSGFSWDFGDGFNSGLNNPQHVFSVPGTYTVTLTGSALFNQCEGSYSSKVTVKELPKAIFEADAKTGCTPFKVNFKPVAPQAGWYYTWDFGDGNTAVSDAPQHAFITPGTYHVKLQVVDESGCKSDSTIYNFVANPTPSAAFSFENKERCTLPAIVNFKNESTGAAGFTWYMGDGTTNVFNAPTHRYNKAGEYGVTMIASNQFNCMDTIQQSIKVYEKPVAKVDIDSYEGCSPMTVVLGNQSTGVNQYFWDFGNGKTSTEKHPTLVYQKPGTYKLRLIASADNVCIDTFDLNAEIIVREGPVANFDVEEVINGGGTGIFKFYNKSKGALTNIWEISDGSIYTDTDIEHRFFNNGAQVVRLTISGNYGCVDDTVMTITPTFIKGLFTPNGFSPENGIGDVRLFKPKGAGLKEYHLQIYSPYGMLLWESTELSGGEPSEGWDGTYKGVLLPQDVYVWKIKAVFDDGTVWRGIPTEAGGYKTMGSVILLR